MLRRLSFGVLLAIATVFFCSNVFGASPHKIKPDEVTEFAIPRMSKAPSIDGTIDPSEWRESVAISGVVEQGSNLLVPRPTTFYLAWDDRHLYLAFRAYVRPNYKPRIRDGRSEGKAWVFDDGLELIFKPSGKNVGPEYKNTAYKMFLNCLGNSGDLTMLVLGQQLKNWLHQFDTATRMTQPGSAPDGGRWWEMEVRTSLDDFNLTGPNRAGDRWKFMLGFNHMPGFKQARIPCTGSYHTAKGKNLGVLVDDSPAVQFTMDSLSNLAADGTASTSIQAYNPSNQKRNVRIEVDVAGEIEEQTSLALAPQEQKSFTLDRKLPQGVKSGAFTVHARDEKRTLLKYKAYFKVNAYEHMLADVEPQDPDEFRFFTEYNPVSNQLLVKADTYYLPDPSEVQSLSYSVKRGDSDEIVARGTVKDVAEWYFQKVLSLPELEPGKYTVTGELNMKTGDNLGPMSGEFAKKNEGEAFPEWWNTDFGDTDRILPPFTGVDIEKRQIEGQDQVRQQISSWGRNYVLNALGLPDVVTSQGKHVLANPARIIVVMNGEEHVVDMGPVQITEQEDWRIRFEGNVDGAGLTFEATGWVEQDGLVYVDLTYGPAGEEPVEVDALRIEYPVTRACAELLLCVGPGNNFASKTSMILPDTKTGELWSTLDTGITGSQMTVGSFYPSVWIGNERRGFLWWADNDKGWFPVDAVPAHEAEGREGTVVFRNNIIGEPVQLDGRRTISFSYMASPFKPLPDSWRTQIASEDGTFFQPFHSKDFKDPATGEEIRGRSTRNWIHPNSRDPEYWDEEWEEWKKHADQHAAEHLPQHPYAARHGVNHTHNSFTLMSYGPLTGMKEETNYFGEEWYDGGMETHNKTLRDHLMWLFDLAFSKGGLRSLYFDITFPKLSDSVLAGLAYRLPDGRIQPGYSGWNIRRFYMRLWSLLDEYNLNPGALEVHSTNAYVTVSLPWTSALLDGERHWDLDVSDRDFVDYYPIERMRPMSVAHNWGMPICWMSVPTSSEEKKKAVFKGVQAEWIWMHDSWRNPYVNAKREHNSYPHDTTKMPTIALEWGMNEPGVVYYPYWRNPFVSTGDDDVLVSLWRIPGQGDDGKYDRVILGVFNYNGETTKNAELKVDLKALGLTPKRKWQDFIRVRDLYTREDRHGMHRRQLRQVKSKLDFDKNVITVPQLKPHHLRLIGIRLY